MHKVQITLEFILHNDDKIILHKYEVDTLDERSIPESLKSQEQDYVNSDKRSIEPQRTNFIHRDKVYRVK